MVQPAQLVLMSNSIRNIFRSTRKRSGARKSSTKPSRAPLTFRGRGSNTPPPKKRAARRRHNQARAAMHRTQHR